MPRTDLTCRILAWLLTAVLIISPTMAADDAALSLPPTGAEQVRGAVERAALQKQMADKELTLRQGSATVSMQRVQELQKQLDEQKRGDEPEFAGYDPSAAFEEEQEDQKRDEEIAEFRESLDEGHREAVEAAQDREPPATVRAYLAVYGQFPKGWPPEVEG